MRRVRRALAVTFVLVVASCGFDKADRYLTEEQPPAPLCKNGEKRCTTAVQVCTGHKWVDETDCAAQGLVCVESILECKTCIPNSSSCNGQTIQYCDSTGDFQTPGVTCDVTEGKACRSGTCVQLCSKASVERSNVGCEYWAVDLDNANVGAGLNAASQQFAVVVSNPAAGRIGRRDHRAGRRAAGQIRTLPSMSPMRRSHPSACGCSSSGRGRSTGHRLASSTPAPTPLSRGTRTG